MIRKMPLEEAQEEWELLLKVTYPEASWEDVAKFLDNLEIET